MTDPGAGDRNVLCWGDGVTEGMAMPSGQDYPARLATFLGPAMGGAASGRACGDTTARRDAAPPNVARRDAPPPNVARRDAAPPSAPTSPLSFIHLFSQHETVERSRHHLPHWEQTGTTCVVTFRLADSLPADKLTALAEAKQRWLDAHPQPFSPEHSAEYVRLFEESIQRWLDAGHGSCVLRRSDVRRFLEMSLLHFDGTRYRMHCFVIMPNHVHALFTPLEGRTVQSILQAWKSFTAKKINSLLGRTGTLWEKESWDRFIRTQRHFVKTVEYILGNPHGMDIPVYVESGLVEAIGGGMGGAASGRACGGNMARRDAAPPNVARRDAAPPNVARRDAAPPMSDIY